MRFAIRADASPDMGGGHVMRCLALADRLSGEGAEIAFICAAVAEPIAQRIINAGYTLHRIESGLGSHHAPGWEAQVLDPESQAEDLQRTSRALARERVDWCVIDHYQLDRHWHSAARGWAASILVIDDLANRAVDCDLLLDQTLGRDARDYKRWAPGAQVLAGPAYALLRQEFSRERAAALARRRQPAPVRRVLISMGSTDVGSLTVDVLERALDAVPDCNFDVVLGRVANSAEQVRALAAQDQRIAIHLESSAMAELMRDADLAVGAAGGTSWERCCVGLPSVAIAVAENQREIAKALAASGAAAVARDAAEAGLRLRELARDADARLAMTAAAAAICDGTGSTAVAEAMVGTDGPRARLRLRRATDADSEVLWTWRNDPLMRAMARNTAVIPWPDHERWYGAVLASSETALYIADCGGKPVAMVRFDRTGREALVSINVSPAMRGRGVGKEALELACTQYLGEAEVERLVAEVRPTNEASRRAFVNAGFQSSDHDGQFERFVRFAGARSAKAMGPA